MNVKSVLQPAGIVAATAQTHALPAMPKISSRKFFKH